MNVSAHTAKDVAKWVLQYNQTEMEQAIEAIEPISNLKLQKLLYYLQGVFLGLTDQVLFSDKILAWAHGPVVEEVYQEYRRFGAAGITRIEEPEETYTEEEKYLMAQVLDEFGQYSAWGLRNMTHSETPWLETQQNDEIHTGMIKDYFKKHYIEVVDE